MLSTLTQLLGAGAPVFRRYLRMAAFYGLLSGLTTAALVPVLSHLLAGETETAAQWLVGLLIGVAACVWWRRRVDQAGIQVGIAALQEGRHRIGEHVARLPIGWFTPDNTARLNHVVSHGVMEVAQLPAHVFTPVISGAVAPVAIVATLFTLQWHMGLIALLALPVIAAVFFLAARLGRGASELFHRDAADVSHRIVEFAQAQSVLRAFSGGNQSDGDGMRFLQQAFTRQQRSGRQLIYRATASAVLNGWISQAVFGALLAVAAFSLDAQMGQALAPSQIIAVIVAMLLAQRFIDPLMDVAGYGEALRGARVQLDAIAAIFSAQALPQPDPAQPPIDASVTLRDVHFRYADEQAEVLRGVNLSIAPGSMTALVGASGSGKSTLVRLVARFFDVTQGSVFVGGVDVRHMNEAQLAAQISQIFQDTYLFQGSIADNIRVGKPQASDDEVLEAARQASVAEIIARLPQGLASQVGEGGARLSGGERQRIAIARALIKRAPIMLIDEATAALDAENQMVIGNALASLRGKCTLIVIAHQLSTVAMADQIAVLDEGKISELGTHDALVQKQGAYARFLGHRHATAGWRLSSRAKVDTSKITNGDAR